MRSIKIAVCMALLLCLCAVSVRAQTVDDLYREQVEASGAEELFENLPRETRALLERLGISSLATETQNVGSNTWMIELLDMVKRAFQKPIASCGMVLGVLLLYAWMQGMRHTLRSDELNDVLGTVCTLTACGAVLMPLAELIGEVCEAIESVSVFMQAFVPIYGGILVTSGQPQTALSFQSIVLYAAQVLAYAVGTWIVPLLTVSLSMSLTGSLTPDLKLGRVGALSGKAASLLLSLGMVLFTGILSFQSLAGGTSDRLSDRAFRFSVSHFVPVVGASLSEAFSTVRGCVHMLKTSVGGLGVIATALIVAPPLCACMVWNAFLSIGEVAADLFGLATFTEMLKNAKSVVRCLIGVLCVSGLVLTVSLTVVTLAAGGTT